MLKRLIYAGAMLLFMAGCSKKVQVQSDTCWTGNINGGSVEACGAKTYSLKGDQSCYVFQKSTEAGYLRIKVKGGSGDEPSTTAAYGVVSGCVR